MGIPRAKRASLKETCHKSSSFLEIGINAKVFGGLSSIPRDIPSSCEDSVSLIDNFQWSSFSQNGEKGDKTSLGSQASDTHSDRHCRRNKQGVLFRHLLDVCDARKLGENFMKIIRFRSKPKLTPQPFSLFVK